MAFSGPFRWIGITFSAGGLIESLSASAEQITGYSAGELVGKPITHVLGDRSVFEIAEMIETARDWGAWEGAIEHRDRSGNTLEGRGSLALLAGCEPAPVRYALITLLERDAAEAPWDRTALEQVGSRLRILAHEINNPLAVIMGFTQLIMLNGNCSGKIRTDMEKLSSEVGRLIQIAERLHSYARTLQRSER